MGDHSTEMTNTVYALVPNDLKTFNALVLEGQNGTKTGTRDYSRLNARLLSDSISLLND